MAETKTKIQEVGEKINDTLGEIIRILRREKPGSPLTKVWYSNGSTAEYEIVGELGYESISDRTNVVKVDIGAAVTSIGEFAFSSCSELTSVMIPDSVLSIGNGAFSGCYGLTSIAIPDSVTSIEYAAFYGCSSLMSITLPDGVTSIGGSVFTDCSSLPSLIIPNSVMSIGDYAFNSCSSLMSVSFLGKTKSQVQGMSNYSWELNTGCTIHCTDGDIVL